MEDYIKNLRKKVGHDELILLYAGCIITDIFQERNLFTDKR